MTSVRVFEFRKSKENPVVFPPSSIKKTKTLNTARLDKFWVLVNDLPLNTNSCLQGYLAHKKPPPPLGPPEGPRHKPTVGCYGRAVSYERGTPASFSPNRFPRGGEALEAAEPSCLHTRELPFSFRVNRGTALIRNHPLPRTTIGPKTTTYSRVLGWGGFL